MERSQYAVLATGIHISDEISNDIYMSVTMRMFSTRANKNNVAVSEAFIDQIIANMDKYVCIPLCADTRKLRAGDHGHLGHMLDRRTGQFLTEQIGSFFSFRKETEEDGVSLIGEARIAKRNPKVCEAIQQLFADGKLNFSFEILAQEVTKQDGVTIIDAADGNELIAMAVVSIPAYPEATALALVAEIEHDHHMQSMLEHASMEIGDIDLDTIRCWLYQLMRDVLGEAVWDYRVERLGVDFAILYSVQQGKTIKLEYAVGENGLTLLDAYEVQYTRLEQDGGMDMDEKNLQAQLVETQDVVRVLTQQKTELDGVIASREERIAEQEKALAETEKARAELFAQVQELTPLQDEVVELRNQIAAAEQEATRKELTQYAQAHGLDVQSETVAKAIQACDAKALMAECLKQMPIHDAKPVLATYAMAGDGMNKDAYGGLLARG